MKSKKFISLILSIGLFSILTFTLSACSSKQADTSSSTSKSSVTKSSNQKRVASDHATMQTSDKTMPTRVIKNGTKIKMYFGKTVISGILNDSKTSKALIAKLPYTISESRYDTDFCGTVEHLPYNKNEVHYGWLNGDIDYATDAPYFTILFNGEKSSEQYGYQVNIGVITTPLSKIRNLHGNYNVRIELDN